MHQNDYIDGNIAYFTGTLHKEKTKHSKEQEPAECKIENPHYARGNRPTLPQEPAEVYSALVQVGGRKSHDQLDVEIGNNMYAELHKT